MYIFIGIYIYIFIYLFVSLIMCLMNYIIMYFYNYTYGLPPFLLALPIRRLELAMHCVGTGLKPIRSNLIGMVEQQHDQYHYIVLYIVLWCCVGGSNFRSV